jgi:hypothetical protein
VSAIATVTVPAAQESMEQILPLTAAAAMTLLCGPVTPFCSNGFVVTSLLKTV